MDQSVTLETSANEGAEVQAGIAQCFAEIDQLREQMSRDQMEIDRSQKRTHALLGDLKAAMFQTGRKAA